MNKIIFILTLLATQIAFSQEQMYEVCPIKVGTEVPNTKLTNDKDEEVMLSAIIGDKPTVMIFYRGAWCGYCIQHLAELNDMKEEMEKLGYRVIGITVDKAEKLTVSSKKAESEIPVYSDAQLETIMAFGLDWKVDNTMYDKYKNEYKLDLEEWSGEVHHSLPVPAIFVVKDSTIEFQYVNPNYRTRLKAETLLAVLKTF